MTVQYSDAADDYVPPSAQPVFIAPPAPKLSREGWALVLAVGVSGFLAAWLVFRWWQVARCVRRTSAASAEISEMLAQARRQAGLRKNVALRVTSEAMSPAVCGLFRPVILLPQSLIEKLTANQLRAVLLHELIHLRRRDVWVNCAQTLLQVFYWWNPLLWVANARVRRVREEAVDDAVMCALQAEAEIYAPTLLEVAKLAFSRPLASLGLVGILESRNALRHRIERLLNFATPRRAGVSMVSVICLAAFTALAVPMGEPPARSLQTANISEGSDLGSEKLIPYHAKVNPEVFLRNIKARAGETMHTTNDDWNDILVSIMDGVGVDCTGPRAFALDTATGQLTSRNSAEVLNLVDEVVKELNLAGGERILNPQRGLMEAFIEAEFYEVRPEDVAKLGLNAQSLHRDADLTPWWGLSSTEFAGARQHLTELGIKPMMSPRIQTYNGIMASLFMGDGTNDVRLECVPYVRDGVVKLSALARTKGTYAPEGKGWPDVAGQTNCAIFSRLNIPDGDGAALVAEPVGATKQLLILLKAKVVDPAANAALEVNAEKESKTFLEEGKLLYQLGKMDEAEARFQHVLAIDPKNHAALYYLSQIKLTRSAKEQVDAQVPKFPNLNASANTINTSTGLKRAPDATTLLADGVSLFQLGKMDEAEAKLQQVLAMEPKNQAALYYESLIKQTRTRQRVDEENITSGAQNVPGPSSESGGVYTGPGRQKLYQKLNTITFDKISYANLPLVEVIRNLTEQTTRRDPDQAGINFLLNRVQPAVSFDPTTGAPTSQAPPDFDLTSVKINADLKNVRLADVLQAIVKGADHPIKYSLFDYGVEFSFHNTNMLELHTRTFRVDVKKFYEKLSERGTSTNKVAPTDVQSAVINFFVQIGVNLAAPKSVFFNDRQGTLTVHATDEDLEHIQSALDDGKLTMPLIPVVGGAAGFTRTFKLDVNTFFMALQRIGVLPVATNGIVFTATTPSGQRTLQRVMSDSDASTFREEFQNALLTYFQGRGVDLQAPKSIFYNDRQSTLTVRATEEDLGKLEQWIAELNMPEDSDSAKADAPVLHTRTFKVDTNTLYEGLKNAGSSATVPGTRRYVASSNPTTELQVAVMNFFEANGVNLTPPKSVFYSDGKGWLTVRATEEDLKRIETALNRLNVAPADTSEKVTAPPAPVVADAAVLRTRMYKVDVNTFFMGLAKQGLIPPVTNATISTAPSGPRTIRSVMSDSDASVFSADVQNGLLTYFRNKGVDLQAPKSLFFNDRQSALTVRATEGDLKLVEAAISILNTAPPEVTVKARFVEVDKELLKTLLSAGVEASTNNAKNRILTEEQFRPIWKGLENRDHADLINEGLVTTLSGRQANFQIVDMQEILFATTNKTASIKTNEVPFGTFLDVIASVGADGYAIQLKVIPNVTEFLGYETTGATTTPLPKIRVRKATMDTVISDGATLMVGDLGDEWMITKPDGTVEQHPFTAENGRQTVVFVTVTIIDASGNRVHVDGANTRPKVVPATTVSYETK